MKKGRVGEGRDSVVRMMRVKRYGGRGWRQSIMSITDTWDAASSSLVLDIYQLHYVIWGLFRVYPQQARAGNTMRLAGWNRLFRRFRPNANGRTDIRTVIRTDRRSYGEARTHLKSPLPLHLEYNRISFPSWFSFFLSLWDKRLLYWKVTKSLWSRTEINAAKITI